MGRVIRRWIFVVYLGALALAQTPAPTSQSALSRLSVEPPLAITYAANLPPQLGLPLGARFYYCRRKAIGR